MHISDWSSDVCSSDLSVVDLFQPARPGEGGTGARQGQEAARQARGGKGQGLEARAGAPDAGQRIGQIAVGLPGWIRKNMPQREEVARNRWLRPVAHRVLRSELWRFPRRSEPRSEEQPTEIPSIL